MRKIIILLSAAFLAAIAAPAFAVVSTNAPVSWQGPITISGDIDVSTAGSLAAAFDMFGPTVTINGVTFTAFSVTGGSQTATNGNFTFTESPGILTPTNMLGSNNTPFSTLSANYQTLLSTAISTSDNNTLTLTISGLTMGQQYLFQWWVNGSTFNPNIGFRTTAAAVNSVTLDDNTTDANGGVGQTVIGTFTAASTSETITFTGTDNTQAPTVNAFQLRAVPEPSTMSILLLGSGLIAGIALRRRRR